jgi:cytochrome b
MQVKVWDRFVRVAHWSLVLSVLGSWATHEGGGRLHEWLGYAALVVLAARIAWGFVGSGHARFASFVVSPAAGLAYAKKIPSHTEPRYLGHNPLGGWMIVALIVMISATGFTGWLYTTDQFWGDKLMEALHEWCANGLMLLVIVHIAGVIFSSRRHHENLVKSMFTGWKRGE